MNLNFDLTLAAGYNNNSQRTRCMTENWVSENMFCPRCGNKKIEKFSNNKPVADFYCPVCDNQYELKSKKGNIGVRINDGAYNTMIERITSDTNPDFFFLSYSLKEQAVKSLMIVPKHFFVPSIIERRKPLSQLAKRAGWVGCNILLNDIPEQGRISVIHNGIIENHEKVVKQLNRSRSLEFGDIEARGWLFDILKCVNSISGDVFTLEAIYQYEFLFSEKHPKNNNIKAKIRQQLQLLRDKGYLEFMGHGNYRKVD